MVECLLSLHKALDLFSAPNKSHMLVQAFNSQYLVGRVRQSEFQDSWGYPETLSQTPSPKKKSASTNTYLNLTSLKEQKTPPR